MHAIIGPWSRSTRPRPHGAGHGTHMHAYCLGAVVRGDLEIPGLGRPRNNESLTRAQSSYVHHACRYVAVPRVRGRTADDESWRF